MFTRGATVSGPDIMNDHTTIVKVEETLNFTGNLTGMAPSIERDVMHTLTDEGRKILSRHSTAGGFHRHARPQASQAPYPIRGSQKRHLHPRQLRVTGRYKPEQRGLWCEGHFHGSLTGSVEGGGSSAIAYSLHWTVATHTEEPEAREEDRDTD